MADLKVSSLASAAPSQLADELPIARSGTSLKATVQNILTALTLLSSGAPAALTDEFLSVRSGAAQKLTLQNVLTLLGQNVARENILIGANADTNPWQDGTSFASPASGAYWADMWQWANTGAGAVALSKSADAPTVAAAGKLINNCFLADCTTADASVATGDYAGLRIMVEGYNWALYGAQRACVLRFWHKHTKTGQHCVALRNSGLDRSLVMEYTQAVSDTWEEAVIDLPASPSAGTWNYTNGTGLYLDFALYAGSSFQGTAGSWQSANILATSNQVNNLDNAVNNFRLADIRLYAGASTDGALRILNRDVETERLLCRRYHRRISADASNNGYWAAGQAYTTTNAILSVNEANGMRAVPTVAYSAVGDVQIFDTGAVALTGITLGGTVTAVNAIVTVAAGLTVGHGIVMTIAAAAGKYIEFNARLS